MMKVRSPSHAIATRKRFFLAASVLAAATAVGADDLPQFRPGLWEFKRSIEELKQGTKPPPVNLQECVDPTANLKKHKETPGCKFSPMTKSGDSYSFTADCQTDRGRLRAKSVITVESDSAYRLRIESQAGDQQWTELLVARRIGDCEK
ncbi:MAG TPA: DUF3617 family protein [Burkholderiales bacterium]|nr:DUF3617 family protein [Burkholderiales bacterium]